VLLSYSENNHKQSSYKQVITIISDHFDQNHSPDQIRQLHQYETLPQISAMTACTVWFLYGTLICCRNQLAPIKSLMSLFPIVTFTKQTNTWFAVAQPSPWAAIAKAAENFRSITYSIPCTFFTDNILYMVQSKIPETHLLAKSLHLHSQHIQSPNPTLWDHKQSRDLWENSKNCHHFISEQKYLMQSTQFAI
jgi:hypothetical protein